MAREYVTAVHTEFGDKQIDYTALANLHYVLSLDTAQVYGLQTNEAPNDVFAWIGRYNQHWWKYRIPSQSEKWDYMYSLSKNIKQEDGYEYQYLGIPFNKIIEAPKFAIDTYTGTGLCGAEHKNVLSVGFEPKLVIIKNITDVTSKEVIFMRGSNATIANPEGFVNGICTLNVTWGDNGIEWYADTYAYYPTYNSPEQSNGIVTPSMQQNADQQQYVWIAIG